MLADANINHTAQVMMGSIDVPPLSLANIRSRVVRHRMTVSHGLPHRRLVAAATALALVALPAIGYSIVSYQTRSRAALEARGGWAPPPPSAAFVSKLKPRIVSLSQARASVAFTLTQPTGLPAGTTLTQIQVSPVGIYYRKTQSWRLGPNELLFRYRSSDGHMFEITAQRFDINALPGRYIFEDRGPDAHGRPILVQHQNFAWQNGDQLTTATDGAIASTQIQAIARSMDGTLLTLQWPSSRKEGELRIVTP